MEEREIEYEKLTFTNDFIFAKVMQNNKELCKHLIEIILGLEIEDVSLIERQKELGATADNRGVRLDVWVKDACGSVYDIEMQVSSDKNLPKRFRYYHSMVNVDMLERGATVEELKKSFVIFICREDFLKSGRCRYTFRRTCMEDQRLVLEDDEYTIVLNPEGRKDGLSEDLQNFLSYIASGKPTDDFTDSLETDVKMARTKKEWRSEYMTMLMMEREKYAEGRREGRKEERDALNRLYAELVKAGRTDDIIKATADPESLTKFATEFGVKLD